MRVTLTRLRSETDGATAVIFVICLVTLFSIAALAVDAGQLWWNRRSLVIDTDAAALAAAGHAREVMFQSGSCDSAGAGDEAEAVVLRNSTTTQFDKTDPTDFDLDCPGNRYGHVTVTAADRTTYAFAGLFRSSNVEDVVAQSHAEFGPLVAADHLRPLPLCVEPGNGTAYSAWKYGPPGPLAVGSGNPGLIFKVEISQAFQATHCNPNGVPTQADFRWIDFDGEKPGEDCKTEPNGNELQDRFIGGYPCLVHVHAYDDGTNAGHNCRPDNGAWHTDMCPTQTGNVASILKCVAPNDPDVPGSGGAGCHDQVCSNLTAAADCPDRWTLLVYDEMIMADKNGSVCSPNKAGKYPGCDAEFHPVGFVTAVLRDAYHGNGVNDPSWVGLEFIADASGNGVIGGPSTPSTHLNVSGVRLCGAEYADNCKG